MGNQIDIYGYLSQLKWQPAVKLSSRERQFLFQFIQDPESVTSMNASINRKIAINIKKQKNRSNNDRGTGDEEEGVVYLSRGPLSKPAVRKRIMKLLENGLIEKVTFDSKTLNKKEFNFKLRRAKPFKITDYGLFCILSHEIEYPTELVSKYWKRSKVLTTLLSPYFEKRSIVHASPYVHWAVWLYLNKACSITNNALNSIKEAAARNIDDNKDNDDTEQERQDIIARLKDDLYWHAKSFALRLLVFPAGGKKKKEQHKKRIRILMNLASDKKFSKLLSTAVYEIQSTYEGLKVPRKQ